MKPEEVRRRIQECKEQRLTELDLSDNKCDTSDNEKLIAIPAEVLNFVWLKQLNLSFNELNELPDSIGNLQNLSKLDLSNNQLTELPDSIGNLQNLSELFFSENQLSELPDSIGNLQNLSRLDLRNNQLTELPDSIGNLQNLSELDLRSNQLTELPDSIGNLQNLSELDLRSNQLTELPDISSLQNLSRLDLRNNQLTELPDISSLQNLSELDLSDNQLSELPDSITLLQNLSELDLRNNQLSELSDSIGNLQNLSELNLRKNQLSEIPNSIGNLQNLLQLDLSSNRLSGVPDISLLQNLSILDLSSNRLSELPNSITLLQNLSQLDLSYNQLSELPDSITLLQNLSEFSLSSNRLSELPDPITLLQNLSELYLSFNQLSELPDSIGNLQNLSQLHLRNNQLKELPDSIGNLQNLSQLHLRNNQLRELPDSIGNLQNLSYLDLMDNPLVNPPIEITGQGIRAIREYFREKAEGEDTLYEAKLIIVGEGGAGKTTLARKMLDPNSPMPKPEETTKGIDVLEWHFKMENDQEFRVNTWDFGGQEIYHATHQFFLTKRSLYLLVVDSRKEHPHLDYWLNIVELFSENSPLLIVKNELGDRPVQMDEPQLKGRFANIKESLPTNLGNPQGGSGLEPIKKAIAYHIAQLPHIGNSLPKTWIKVREKLEEDERNYISLDQYLQICDQNGFKFKQESIIDGRLVLSQYFHDLGSILHFQEDQTSPLYKTVILKPKWGTDAAYKVLDNNQVKQNLGKFTTTELKQIWQDIEYRNMQGELLELMLKFKLCYPLPNAKNTYIAPQLLDSNQPEYFWNDSDNLLLRYEYDFMPRGILTRFIVEMHHFIDEPNVWKSGVLLKRDHTWAEVIETYDRREIKIRLSGSNKRGFLEVITDKLDEIHATFNQLKVKKLIPCNCDVCKDSQTPHFYDLNKLRERLANRKDNIECDKPPYNQVNVLSLIDDIGNRNKLLNREQDKNHRGIIVMGDVHGDIKVQDTDKGQNIMEENCKKTDELDFNSKERLETLEKQIDSRLVVQIYQKFQSKALDLLNTDWDSGMRNLSRLINFIDTTPIINEFIEKSITSYPLKEINNLKNFLDSIIREGKDEQEISFLYQLLKDSLKKHTIDKEWNYVNLALIFIDPMTMNSGKFEEFVIKFNKDIIQPCFIQHIDLYLQFLMNNYNSKPEENTRPIINTQAYYEQTGNFGIGQMSGGQIQDGAKFAGIINESQQKSLAEVAKEIQELLDQLSQTNPTTKTTEKMKVVGKAIDIIEENPSFKSKIIKVLTAVGTESFKEAVDHPLANIFIAGVEAWTE